ncbi:MAG: PepSY-associated TM helix domain-containing protein [Bacteroidales bacterium]
MKIRRINRAIHRDLGYFFFGMCIIYGLSGIALNHRHQWNPSYIVTQKSFGLQPPGEDITQTEEMALHFLAQLDREEELKTSLKRGDNLRIFIDNGSVTVNIFTGEGELETVRRRPVFREVNFLHYNTPRKLWTWFSDLFAAGLIILAFTGLFILKGKKGITGRGAWLTGAGIAVPLAMLMLYFTGW